MRAAVVTRYGPPSNALVTDVPEPTARQEELLVHVHAAAVTSGDARIRAGSFPKGMGTLARLGIGLRGPRSKVLGMAFSGVVAQTAAGSDLQIGDRVAGMTGSGAHAERMAVKARRVVRVPESVSHEAAAAVLFGSSTALFYLHELGSVQPGQTVLVNGASGAVGTSSVQFTAAAGAEVTGVTSARNAELVRSLGAASTVDYEQRPVADLPDRFDMVIDMVGNISPRLARRLVTPDGIAVLGVAGLGEMMQARGQVRAGVARALPEHFSLALAALADGSLQPVIQAALPLEQIPDAYAIVDSGRKVGNVIVLPQQ